MKSGKMNGLVQWWYEDGSRCLIRNRKKSKRRGIEFYFKY
jgi:hypothetical protein